MAKDKELVGAKIIATRAMTAAEKAAEGWEDWHGSAIVLELDNGLIIYPSADDEGNGPGALFGVDTETKTSLWFGVK